MLFAWREIPAFRLLFPFVVGILLSAYFPSTQLWLPALGLSLVALILLHFFTKSWKFRWVFGVALLLVFIFFGQQRTNQHDERNASNHFSRLLVDNQPAFVHGTITDTPQDRGDFTRLLLTVDAFQTDSVRSQSASGKLMVYLPTDTNTAQLAYGDQLTFTAYLNRVEGAKNPEAFDYAQYLHFQNIHYQCFIREAAQWQSTSIVSNNPRKLLHRLRETMLAKLTDHMDDPASLGVAKALILGEKTDLSPEVRTTYANTGAMHVLAVSGLHVGLIYLILDFLLGLFLPLTQRSTRGLRTGLLLLFIWLYAFLTGASPSVLRAATMFSAIIIGKGRLFSGNIYNTLAASALILLIINPFLLFQVGFQLSYLAVFGIVYIQPKLYKRLYFKPWLLDKAWQLTTVAIAAQIATAPIAIYYFHQFPTYFFLSGLIVIPGAFLVLSMGFVFFVFVFWWDTAAAFSGDALNWIIWLMNTLIADIDQYFPWAVIPLWLPSLGTVLFLYAFIGLSLLAIQLRRARIVNFALLALLLFCSTTSWQRYQRQQQKQLVIYQVSKHTLIDVFVGNHHTTIRDTLLDAKTESYAAENYRLSRGTRPNTSFTLEQTDFKNELLFKKGSFAQIGNQRFLIIDTQTTIYHEELPPIDYVLLRGNPTFSPDELLPKIKPKQVIIDGAMSFYERRRWNDLFRELGIPVHETTTKGAFIVDL